VNSNWPALYGLKKETNRVSEEVGDRNEMDPVLLIVIGAAIFHGKTAESMPKFLMRRGIKSGG